MHRITFLRRWYLYIWWQTVYCQCSVSLWCLLLLFSQMWLHVVLVILLEVSWCVPSCFPCHHNTGVSDDSYSRGSCWQLPIICGEELCHLTTKLLVFSAFPRDRSFHSPVTSVSQMPSSNHHCWQSQWPSTGRQLLPTQPPPQGVLQFTP